MAESEKVVLALHSHSSNMVWDSQYAGLVRYCRPRGWKVRDCCLGCSPTAATIRRILRGENIVGIISSLGTPLPEDVHASLPIVCFDCPKEAVPPGCPHIRHDAVLTAHLAANELMSLRLHCFSFAHSPWDRYWSRDRGTAFEREIVHRSGIVHPAFRLPGVFDKRRLVPALVKWLADIPKPCGIFAANDEIARAVILAGLRLSLKIPSDMAVVGVDDDPQFCVESPSLSSVVPDWNAGAFLAAQVLDRLVRGVRMAEESMMFRPMGLMRRRSTGHGQRDIYDPSVRKAVDTIREKACSGLRAREVLGEMRGSRRYAEGVFRGLTGMSVLEAIRRVRFENAKVLLETTDKPVALVGSSSGYQSETTFCREFKSETGLTPAAWRKKSRT